MTEEFATVVRLYRLTKMELDSPRLDHLVIGLLGRHRVLAGTPQSLLSDHAALVMTRTLGYCLHVRQDVEPYERSMPMACELARWDRLTHGPQEAPIESIGAALLLPAKAVRRALKEGQTAEEIAYRWHAPVAIAELRVRLVSSPGKSGEYPSVRRLAIA